MYVVFIPTPRNDNIRDPLIDEWIKAVDELYNKPGDIKPRPRPDRYKGPYEGARGLSNFIWFFKFELSFREKEIQYRRDQIDLVE